mgnify:CR=1 FL=1
MPKKWKPTAKMLVKEGTEAKRALAAWHKVAAAGEPYFNTPYKANRGLARNVYLYAAALGQKRGALPGDLDGWTCWGWNQPKADKAWINFGKPGMADPVTVELKNLTAWPAPPVETEEAPEWAMAA